VQSLPNLLPGLDASKLHDKLIFQSESAHEVRTELSGMLSEHALALGRGRVNTQLFACHLQNISIMKLRYGAEVTVRATAFDGFSLVQTPLRGAFDACTEGVRCRFSPGDVAVLSPRHDIDIHWQQGSEQIIVKVPHRLLAALHVPGAQASSPAGQGTTFQSPVFKLNPCLIPLWHALVQQAINLSDGDGLTLNPDWLTQFEYTLSRFVVTHQDRGVPLQRTKSPPPCRIKTAGLKQAGLNIAATQTAVPVQMPMLALTHTNPQANPLTRMQDYIRQHLGAAISLLDLAQAAGISPRSLNTLCRQHHGVSPMVMLRNLRLDEVRRALRTRTTANVTAIALDHGFGHLGRFSAYYRQRFGELPRETASNRTETMRHRSMSVR